MDERDKVLIEALKTTNPELQRLAVKHEEYEARLASLSAKRWRAPGEDVEERRLKRLKLQGRDRMATILAQHRASKAS